MGKHDRIGSSSTIVLYILHFSFSMAVPALAFRITQLQRFDVGANSLGATVLYSSLILRVLGVLCG